MALARSIYIYAKKGKMDTNVLVGSTSRPTDDVVEDKSAQPLANGSCGISWAGWLVPAPVTDRWRAINLCMASGRCTCWRMPQKKTSSVAIIIMLIITVCK